MFYGFHSGRSQSVINLKHLTQQIEHRLIDELLIGRCNELIPWFFQPILTFLFKVGCLFRVRELMAVGFYVFNADCFRNPYHLVIVV